MLNEQDRFVDRPDFLAGLRARDFAVPAQFWGARADESGHFYGVPRLGGRFPDSLWLTICDADSASIGCAQLRWEKGRWDYASIPGNTDAEAEWFCKFAGPFQSWSEGRFISRNTSSGGAFGQPFFVFEGKTGKWLSSPPEAALPPGEFNGFNAVARAFPSGEILLWNGSADCEQEGEPCGVVFATYSPKSNRFHSYELPDLSGYGMLVAAHPGEAWALARMPREGEGKRRLRLVHFDGKELKLVPTTKPLFEGASLALSSPTDLWVVNQGELFRLGNGGQLNSVELPKPLYAKASAVSKVTVRLVAVARNGDIYVQGTYVNQAREAKNWTKRGIVYRSRPVTAALHCDYRADGGSILAPLPPRADEQCANPLALLTVIRKSDNPKRTKAEFDRILKQNDAFKALSIREGAFGSRRYWTASVPSVSVGERLVAKVAEQIKHATPELVCDSHQPQKPSRELAPPFDSL
jgi:hypothetical protein